MSAGTLNGQDWYLEGDDADEQLGSELAIGDFDGDGFDDWAIGTHHWQGNGLVVEGRVLVFYGADELPLAAGWEATGGSANAMFSASLASVGDPNDDGFDDLLIGAPGTGALEGVVLYLGSAEGLQSEWSWAASQEGQGLEVAGPGDLNGDGWDDAVLSRSGGSAQVYLGGALVGLQQAPVAELSDGELAILTEFVTPGGDLNGDGLDDFVATRTCTRAYAGAEPDGPLGGTPLWAVCGADGPPLTAWGAALGDLDGDGFDDIVMGNPLHTNPDFVGEDHGIVRAWGGGPDGPSYEPSWSHQGEGGQQVGASVRLGDLNGDGHQDLVTASIGPDEVHVFLGTGSIALPDSAALTWSTGLKAESLGLRMVSGDVNGDGFDDVVASDPGFPFGGDNRGAVFVFLGCGDLDGDGSPDLPGCPPVDDDDDDADDDDDVTDDDDLGDDDFGDDDDADDDDLGDDDDTDQASGGGELAGEGCACETSGSSSSVPVLLAAGWLVGLRRRVRAQGAARS